MKRGPLIFGLGLCLVLAPLACSKSDADKRTDAKNAAVTGEPARSKPFVASVLREPFHRSTCKWAKKIHTENLVGYDSGEDAIADGHRPCEVCKPLGPPERPKGLERLDGLEPLKPLTPLKPLRSLKPLKPLKPLEPLD